MLKNSTNIPDKLIAVMVAFALPPDCSEFVTSITVKNKKRGKTMGTFGWYYHRDRRVVIILPRVINRRHNLRKKYSRVRYQIDSRAELLLATLAHEFRHAWQRKHWNTDMSRWKLEMNRIGRYAQEFDAERYDLEMLKKWKEMWGSVPVDRAASQI